MEIEQLADLYESFYDSLERLLEVTVKYLNNVIKDFREMDEKRSHTVDANKKYRNKETEYN